MRKLLLGVLFILAGILGLGVGSAAAEPLANNKQVATGQNHSCALTRTGQVNCWGDNTTGALGDGTFDSSVTPVAVKGIGGVGELTKVKQITAGNGTTCALLTNRRVVCWGENFGGQLGDGTFDSSNTPVAVKGIGGIGELTNVKQITAGYDHTCALKTNGQVNCWGDGDGGRLGDGLSATINTPVAVTAVGGSGVLTKVRQVTAGGLHTCALATNGRVTCWGSNDSGQVGDGSEEFEIYTPVDVKGIGGNGVIVGVKQLEAGGTHTCALKTNGQVNCWGGNFSGQLGDGTEDASNTPVAVKAVGGSGVLGAAKGIVAGAEHSCALLRNGRVNCWGSNFAGELGDGTNDESNTPVVVEAVGGGSSLARIKQIDAGNHSCALTLTGQVVCWGFNGDGQLGDGTNNASNTPVFVDDGTLGELTKVKQTAGGGTYTCALLTNGRVNCWGSNFAGELGDGTTNQSNVPVAVKAVGGGGELTRVKQIAAGVSHACALLTNGRVNCWGYNGAGGLGDGTNTDSSTPVVVQAVGGGGELTRVKQITAGVDQTCALLTNGRVNCWGSNVDGELGDATNADSSTPVVVQAVGGGGELTKVKQVTAGDGHTCALLTTGRVNCWGDNLDGELGDGTNADSNTPVVVQAVGGGGELTRVKQIDAGDDHNCALLTNGRVNCWGFNLSGGLGDGTNADSNTPVVVQAVGGGGELTRVKQITAGYLQTCALLTNGRVNCWGRNSSGELGDGTNTNSSTPVVVQAVGGGGELTKVKQISAGSFHTCGLLTDGRVNCWGFNLSGGLGNGTNTSSNTPVVVAAAL